MPEEKNIEIWDCQEWIRTAPLKEVHEFIHWARGVVEMREEFAAQSKRKRRSDVGKKRAPAQELPFDPEQEADGPIDIREIVK